MRFRPHVVLVALALVSSAACTGQKPKETQQEVVPVDPVNDPGRPGKELQVLIDAGLNTGPDEFIPAALEGLKKPETMEESRESSKYYADIDDLLFTISYTGLIIKGRDVMGHMQSEEDQPKRRIEAIIITDENYRTGSGIQVGMTRDQAIEKLGEPTEERGTTLIYDQGKGHKLYVRLQGPQINTMQWDFNPDFGVPTPEGE